MQLGTGKSSFHTLVRAVSLTSTGFIFTILLGPSALAQQTTIDPWEEHIPPREHQEWLDKAREGKLVRPDTPKQQQLRLTQIREDFRTIQLVNADTIRPAIKANTLDYQNLAKASSEIKRSAVRLKSNLVLPATGDKSHKADDDSRTYRGELKRLDELIWSFVSNGLFHNAEVIDVQLATRASQDLGEIIKVSDWLKRKHD
jgi:hypothetical protein